MRVGFGTNPLVQGPLAVGTPHFGVKEDMATGAVLNPAGLVRDLYYSKAPLTLKTSTQKGWWKNTTTLEPQSRMQLEYQLSHLAPGQFYRIGDPLAAKNVNAAIEGLGYVLQIYRHSEREKGLSKKMNGEYRVDILGHEGFNGKITTDEGDSYPEGKGLFNGGAWYRNLFLSRGETVTLPNGIRFKIPTEPVTQHPDHEPAFDDFRKR